MFASAVCLRLCSGLHSSLSPEVAQRCRLACSLLSLGSGVSITITMNSLGYHLALCGIAGMEDCWGQSPNAPMSCQSLVCTPGGAAPKEGILQGWSCLPMKEWHAAAASADPRPAHCYFECVIVGLKQWYSAGAFTKSGVRIGATLSSDDRIALRMRFHRSHACTGYS